MRTLRLHHGCVPFRGTDQNRRIHPILIPTRTNVRPKRHPAWVWRNAWCASLIVLTVDVATAMAKEPAIMIDSVFFGGNIRVQSIEAHVVRLGKEGSWFYWHFLVREVAGRTQRFEGLPLAA